ncbi:MAG: 25S rRNA (adenine645-N1)-methyltransferase [Chrysothrix sp. TS-e1954]|nr:MAG: 25S rRNA (adenine645-N1)-methyltransferase [Chrysothrix sp. TS-e1954]
MFAVPGWTLPQAPKTQAELPPGKSPSSENRKRKRKGRGGAETRVDGSNVAELWRQHVEGLPPSKGSEQASEREIKHEKASKEVHEKPRKRKREDGQAVSGQEMQTDPLKKQKSNHKPPVQQTPSDVQPISKPPPTPIPAAPTTLTPLQAKMRQKLMGAHFRHLNETLYTSTSTKALQLFDSNPDFFKEYHSGFREQVSSWPENPVDAFARDLERRGRVAGPAKGKKPQKETATDPHSTTNNSTEAPRPEPKDRPLPRSNNNNKLCKIADLGCGDASLLMQVRRFSRKTNIEVLSYDLHSTNPKVTRADISSLPLEANSISVAIFCLALMGTNWLDFIDEAWRVLHWKGELWIAEIKSRFGVVKKKHHSVEHSVVGKAKKPTTRPEAQKGRDKQEEEHQTTQAILAEVDGSSPTTDTTTPPKTDISPFIRVLEKRGFALQDEQAIDLSNKMFAKLRFVKALPPTKGKHAKSVSMGSNNGGAPPSQRAWRRQLKEEEGDDGVEEGKVLKPCLYKIR